MAASRSVVERWAPRRSCFSVRLAKKRSTWFIQEADVGVKCTCQRGRWANQLRIAWVLWLDTLSMTMWMSRSSGTLASMAFKNTRNSRARCRAKHRPMTLPVAASRAANRQRAVTGIIVGAALGLPGAPWQQGLGAVQSLDLTLLVHAQHKGVLGWGHVEPDDVAHLLHEQRIARELEGLDPVRLQSEGFPDAVDCRRRVTHRLGPSSAATNASHPVVSLPASDGSSRQSRHRRSAAALRNAARRKARGCDARQSADATC